MFTCFHPLVGPMVLAMLLLGLAGGAIFLLGFRHVGGISDRMRNFSPYGWFILTAIIGATIIILWLGSYAYSPLSFAKQPVLRAFEVQKRGQQAILVKPGQGFSIPLSSIAYIAAISVPAAKSCNWMSSGGAAIDANQTCDIVYQPPSTEVDILRVNIQPYCGLPPVSGQIKIAVLP